jgi:hypothetical protein
MNERYWLANVQFAGFLFSTNFSLNIFIVRIWGYGGWKEWNSITAIVTKIAVVNIKNLNLIKLTPLKKEGILGRLLLENRKMVEENFEKSIKKCGHISFFFTSMGWLGHNHRLIRKNGWGLGNGPK